MIMIDRLIDKVNELAEAEKDFQHSCRKYRKKYPFRTICSEHLQNDEERRIVYASRQVDKMNEVIWSLCYVLDLSREQQERLCKAARAMRKWYEMTEYQLMPPESLNNKLLAYIMG